MSYLGENFCVLTFFQLVFFRLYRGVRMHERKKEPTTILFCKTKTFVLVFLDLSGQEELFFNYNRPPPHRLLTNKRDKVNKDSTPKGLSF